MRISISAGHKTSFLRHEWRDNLTAQKSQDGTCTSCFAMSFMPLLHSASLSLVRRPTSVLRDEWRENATLHKVPETTRTSFFIMMLMSPVHFASLLFVGWTTCFRMILIYLVYSSSFSLVRLSTNSLHLEQLDKSIFQSCPAEVAGFLRIS